MTPGLVKIIDSSTVADYNSVESPAVAQNLLQQTIGTAARLAFKTLIGTHHLTHIGVLHECAESREIGLPQVALRQVGDVEAVAHTFRTAVHGIMLGTSQALVIARSAVALQSAHHPCAHTTVHVRILAVGLLPSSPSRVAEHVDIRRPESDAAIVSHGAVVARFGVFCAALVADSGEYAFYEVVVERSCHAYA